MLAMWLERNKMDIKQITEKWNDYISTADSPEDEESLLMQAYERFRAEIAHTWAMKAAQQVVELTKQGVDFEAAYQQVDKEL